MKINQILPFLVIFFLTSCANEDLFEKYIKHVEIMSSDEFEGRAPGTLGGEKTKKYIADHYASLGLSSFGDSYLLPVNLTGLTLDESTSFMDLKVDGESLDLVYRRDMVYWTKRQVANALVNDSELVFVGYGVNAPEYGWNDYKIDVTGKTVVMLINDPGFELQGEDFNGKAMTYYGRWTYKFEEAARQGAVGAIIIHETAPAAYGWNVVETSWSGEQVDLSYANKNISRAPLEAWVTLEIGEALFESIGMSYDEMKQQALSKDFMPMPITTASLSSNIDNDLNFSESHNVIGYVEGSESPDEYIMIMAHWDHLGIDPNLEGDQIYNGALDNATGTAAVMHMAEVFSQRTPKRSIVFIGLTAEESGLLGSAYMAENMPFKPSQTVAGLNMDAMSYAGKARDIIIIGYGASELEPIMEKYAAKEGKYLAPDKAPEKGFFYRSDHISFAKKGIPVLYADPGIDLLEGGIERGMEFANYYTANDYHQVSDEITDKWDYSGIEQDLGIFTNFIDDLANSVEYPNWYENNEFRAIRDQSLNNK